MARRGQPKNLLEAVREVGNEAFANVYKLALEREAVRRQGVELPPLVSEPPEESEVRRQRYKTGEEIRLGDQIRYAGSRGIVTSVIYGPDCSSENENEERSNHAIALTITTDAHPLVFIDQAERDLEFLGRSYPIRP